MSRTPTGPLQLEVLERNQKRVIYSRYISLLTMKEREGEDKGMSQMRPFILPVGQSQRTQSFLFPLDSE